MSENTGWTIFGVTLALCFCAVILFGTNSHRAQVEAELQVEAQMWESLKQREGSVIVIPQKRR